MAGTAGGSLLAAVMALWVLIFGNDVYQLFVQNDPEVLFTWDEHHPVGYWTTFESPAFESIFGFPIRNGWQSVAALYDQGVLHGRLIPMIASAWCLIGCARRGVLWP